MGMKKWIAAAAVLCASSLRALPWIETARLIHGGGSANDEFGFSVAIDGDVAVVGRPGGPFAAVFVRSGGVWNEAASLVTTDGQYAAGYGESVAISGDTIVIGEPGFNEVTGKAYVFVRPPGGWAGTISESAQLVDPAGTHFEQFGTSVSISGDTIAAGAPVRPTGPAVFVFERPRSGWSGTLDPSALLESASATTMGFSVGISGDVVVSGESGGEGHLWLRPTSGWSGVVAESAELLPATILSSQYSAVAIDGDTVVVTAPGALYLNSDNQETNVAYVFEKPSAGWSGTVNETARLVPSASKLITPETSETGFSVSISNATIVVGSPGMTDFPFSTNDGSAFVFAEPPTGWSGDIPEQAKILGVDADARQSSFGWSVSISGTSLLAGARYETVGGNAAQGAAHIFEPGLDPIVTAAFSPGSVLTHEPSTLTLTITNPNATGFLWQLATTASFPPGLAIDTVPNASTTCGGGVFPGATAGDTALGLDSGEPLFAGSSCTVSANVSSLLPGTFTTVASPVSCDQGCDGIGSSPVTLLVRLRQTQTRILVQGPIRVAPGVPVEFSFQVDPLRESPIAPTGEVVVSDGAGHACRSDVSLSGQGSCTLTFGSPGTYRVRAEYLGNLSFASSTSFVVPVLVGKGGAAP
jgi:hypothetical protein